MQLRQYQQDAHDRFWDSLLSGRGHPLIDLPTGSGKSPTLAAIARTAVEKYKGRVVIVAHRKELIRQNAEKLQLMCPGIPVGLYSAGLNSRDTEHPILVAGIQSVYGKASELGRRHLLLVDEAHLIPKSENTMYGTFIDDLGRLNPKLKIGGLTATPWRLDSGPLWGPKEMFSHVCYRANISELIASGYLSRLTSKPSDVVYDTSRLHMRGGDYIAREVVDLFSDAGKALAACKELVASTRDRKSVIVFCASVSHAETVQEMLEELTSERVDLVTGETSPLLRLASLDAFSKGECRFLVSIDVLTTGFDSPRIDCVALMRSTASSGLYCQMVGRGLRVFPNKSECLILDFGENIKRHGPIDAIDFGNRTSGKGNGEAPQKTCPGCNSAVSAGVRTCECGFRFPDPEIKHGAGADTESPILSEPEEFLVEGMQLSRNKGKDGKRDTLRVTYLCRRDGEEGNLFTEQISEWVCLEHPLGFPKTKAMEWWGNRSLAPFPSDIDAAINLWASGAMSDCSSIKAQKTGKFWRVIEYQLSEKPDFWQTEIIDEFEEEELPF